MFINDWVIDTNLLSPVRWLLLAQALGWVEDPASQDHHWSQVLSEPGALSPLLAELLLLLSAGGGELLPQGAVCYHRPLHY